MAELPYITKGNRKNYTLIKYFEGTSVDDLTTQINNFITGTIDVDVDNDYDVVMGGVSYSGAKYFTSISYTRYEVITTSVLSMEKRKDFPMLQQGDVNKIKV